MPYLIPPMDPEPPREYVDFVAGCIVPLQGEAARLAGGARHAEELATEALTDVAGQWRLLRWWHGVTRRDPAAELLRRRLAVRAKQWREEQIYPVEVRVAETAPSFTPLPPPAGLAAAEDLYRRPSTPAAAEDRYRPPSGGAGSPPAMRPGGPPVAAGSGAAQSVARRLAPLVDPTVRPQARPVAEAGIAWVHAYRRHRWWQFARAAAGVLLVVGGMIRVLSQIPGP